MIDRASSDALTRVAERAADVLGAYDAGFEPALADASARTVRAVPLADPLSVVAPAGTYFASRAADGSVRFSRDGGFRFEGGELRSRDGAALLGVPSGAKNAALAPLRVDPVEAALGRIESPRIEPDGTVTYVRAALDPRTGERRSERVALGRLALARFPAGTELERIDATHVRPPKGVAAAFAFPGSKETGALRVGARDLGRLDPVASLERLGEAYQLYDALQAAGGTRAKLGRVALDLIK